MPSAQNKADVVAIVAVGDVVVQQLLRQVTYLTVPYTLEPDTSLPFVVLRTETVKKPVANLVAVDTYPASAAICRRTAYLATVQIATFHGIITYCYRAHVANRNLRDRVDASVK